MSDFVPAVLIPCRCIRARSAAPLRPAMSSVPNTPLLEDSFDLKDQVLFWSRLRLYADRLTLRGWQGLTCRHRCIPLCRIERVEQPATDRLVLHLEEDHPLRLMLDDAGRWRKAIVAHRDV